MDPLTLLAAASAAVNAVKKGCELYKEAKGAAGNVKEIIEDLRKQFNKGPRTKEAKEQYEAEVARVKETAAADPGDTIAVIGDNLGKFFDAYDAIEKLFWEQEKEAQEVYEGGVSLGRRALQRVLIRSRLEIMQAEIREEMVYRTPPELKDLYTRFEKMRGQILEEQREAHVRQWRKEQQAAEARRRKIEEIKEHALWIAAVVYMVAWGVGVMLYLRYGVTLRGFS